MESRSTKTYFSFILQLLGVAVALTIFLYLLVFSHTLQWEKVWEYRALFLKGWLLTLFLSVLSLLLSTCIGLVCALMAASKISFLHYAAKIYVEIIRGTPLLVQILLFYYVIANAVGLQNRYVAGVISLSIFSGAYISEIIRSGVESISSTQLQAARAIGLTGFQTYRFVIFPQAIRHVLPPLSGQFASIIKDSSLLSIIGISELTNIAQQINSATYSTLESFFPLAIGYLLLTLPLSLWSKYMESKFRYET